MNLLSRASIGLLLLICLTVGVQPGQAQDNTSACVALVRNALLQVGNNCADLGRNGACYGFSQIQSILDEGVTDIEPLSKPADKIDITKVAVIDASALSLSTNSWGIGPIAVRANLPVALPGRDLLLVPIGDVEVENGVEPAEALILPAESLAVTVGAATDLFREPSVGSQVVGQAAAGTTLQADGISPDGEWLRVYYEHEGEYSMRATAWLGIGTLGLTPDTRTLPTIGPDSLTPMQKFYLRNAFTTPDCSFVPPPVLFIQGPENIETDFTVNGADIRVSSAVTLRLVPPGNIMELAVLSGLAVLNPKLPNPLVVPAGFVTYICLTDPLDLGIDDVQNDREVAPGCTWREPRQFRQPELALWSALPQIPPNILNYRFTLPRLVCPSGVGQPVCEIIIDDQRLLAIVRKLCRAGIIPSRICRLIRGL